MRRFCPGGESTCRCSHDHASPPLLERRAPTCLARKRGTGRQRQLAPRPTIRIRIAPDLPSVSSNAGRSSTVPSVRSDRETALMTFPFPRTWTALTVTTGRSRRGSKEQAFLRSVTEPFDAAAPSASGGPTSASLDARVIGEAPPLVVTFAVFTIADAHTWATRRRGNQALQICLSLCWTSYDVDVWPALPERITRACQTLRKRLGKSHSNTLAARRIASAYWRALTCALTARDPAPCRGSRAPARQSACVRIRRRGSPRPWRRVRRCRAAMVHRRRAGPSGLEAPSVHDRFDCAAWRHWWSNMGLQRQTARVWGHRGPSNPGRTFSKLVRYQNCHCCPRKSRVQRGKRWTDLSPAAAALP